MCQLTPLNHANVNGPAYDQANPSAKVVTSRAASASDAYCLGLRLRLRTDDTMIAVFQTSTATMANPPILCTAMNRASSDEPDTSPKKPLTNSTQMRASSIVLAHGVFTSI